MDRDDEAVSSVVAMMLILAIVATLIAVYSATYLPGLKQQAEIEHIHEVRDAFVRFGADIEQAVDRKDVCRFSEPFSLGGGDVLLSPVKSSGTLTVQQEDPPLVEVSLGGREWYATLVDITYRPSFTAWEPQGYTWQEGYVNVTKGKKETPLLKPRLEDFLEDRAAFAQSFLEIGTRGDQGYCTDLVVTLVQMHPGKGHERITGNGMANLHLNASVREEVSVGGSLTISVPTGASDTDPIRAAMNQTIGERCKDLFGPPGAPCYKNVAYVTGGGKHTLTFTDPEAHPVAVKVRTVDIGVNAW